MRTAGPAGNRAYAIPSRTDAHRGRTMILCPPTVLLRIEFTASDSLQPMGELLPRLSILTGGCLHRNADKPAVYFCCTFPEVAFGGRYPLSLPCGARTFLMAGLSPPPRDCLFYSRLLYRKRGGMSTKSGMFFGKYPRFWCKIRRPRSVDTRHGEAAPGNSGGEGVLLRLGVL